MSEPVVIYRATDGEPLTVYGPAAMAALLASGEYVSEPKPPPTPEPTAGEPDDKPAPKARGKRGP